MAVYTDVSDEELAAFVAGYDLGTLVSFKGIAEGVENSNFLLRTQAGQYILTLYEKRVNEGDLPFFLGLMDHLAAKGLNCPTPVKAKSGEALGRLADRPAAIVTFLDGMSVRRPRVSHCTQVGEVLADFHAAGRDFDLTRENALSVSGWRPLFDLSRERADEVLPGLRNELERELDALEACWPRDLPTGVIHADLFPDNVFFLGETLSGLIDFYFACNDLLAYDLAICINAWCFEPDRQFNVTKARAMVAGYQRRRPLSKAEQEALPLLARGSALRFLLTRLYDWLSVPPGALVVPKNPLEYLYKLRFHRDVTSLAAYGVA
ncbi:Homoserine kinase [Hartmannibacter diazotrophicus]|uniref:Homoserine kinase n=1 Tax=Hartmannibacter diazotrophicus TaxID=1482074 RepID=A0A2C9D3R2_9HYPH|nr:homoserine kinase [Hartmannibacter diazotrophicus]SON54798.1 Homoserine kinase [Hartmannibacter diazotrophicus]